MHWKQINKKHLYQIDPPGSGRPEGLIRIDDDEIGKDL
jgi:hypothetical protein